jgi:Domain of unknown function (DUF4173)
MHNESEPLSHYRNNHYPQRYQTTRAAVRQPALRRSELLGLLALIALGDLAYVSYNGVGQAITLACVPPLLWFTAQRKLPSTRMALLLLAALLLAARSVYLPTAFATGVGIVALMAFAQVLRMPQLHAPEFLLATAACIVHVPRRFDALVKSLSRATHVADIGAKVAGTALAVGLIGLFASILGLANPALARIFHLVWTWSIANLPSVTRLSAWLGFLTAGLLLLRPAVKRAFPWQPYVAEDTLTTPLERGFAYATLGGLNLLFCANNLTDARQILQFTPPPGMSTQAYAHGGALWLTLVLVMVNLTVGLLFRGALAVAPALRSARILAYVVLGQSLVLAALTFARMWMHVTVSGLSNLHIFGFLGASLVVFGLFSVAYKLAKAKSLTFLLRRQLEASLVAAVLFALLPTHAIAAHYNVGLLRAGNLNPIVQLTEQAESAESIVMLVPLLDHPNPVVHGGVRALLIAYAERSRRRPAATVWTRGYAESHADTVVASALATKRGTRDDVSVLCQVQGTRDLCALMEFMQLQQSTAQRLDLTLHGSARDPFGILRSRQMRIAGD